MGDPLWYKDAIFYELHVRAFHDGNQDGIGDFVGLTERLEYLADLGITAVWLLPFTVSPLKDDGYDIADYTSVHPNYGNLDDFRRFLARAHSLGIRVITELVINHTSDQHPWFQRARNAPPGSPERDFYVWSDDPERYAGVPLMFPDFEKSNWSWDPVARQYYWHRFYSHQPDLNFDNPAVHEAILPLVDFWFELGVDGMRLDAVPYLVEREGTRCEHLPETHAFLKELRQHTQERFPDRMFLAEANAWPDEMVKYFGSGDECQMAFHFPLMPRLFLALHQENRFPITDVLAQTPDIPANCQWCLFLRNHDEMTLAMVTDEERDAMFAAYTRDHQARLFLGIRHRLAPLLRNDRRRIELLNAILFSLAGSPVIYYGDEIGMGDNIYLGDRNGVRTPMQWNDDRNAGFSRANSQKLYLPIIVDSEYHYEAVNVEAQQNNPSSLLWWMKRIIRLRKKYRAFGRGDLQVLEPENAKVLAYVRQTESECLLIVANLSRFVQNVQLDLSSYAGLVPEEMFGRSRFPAIRQERYGLTLGPYGFYWFSLVPEQIAGRVSAELPRLDANDWKELVRGEGWETLSPLLVAHQLSERRQQVVQCRLLDVKIVMIDSLDARLFIYRVEYSTNEFETLFVTLALVSEERFEGPRPLPVSQAIAKLAPSRNVILCDATALPEYRSALLAAFKNNQPILLSNGDKLVCAASESLTTSVNVETVEQTQPEIRDSNLSTIELNEQFLLRNYRRAAEGLNPDVEIGTFLQQQGFEGIAKLVGTVALAQAGLQPVVLAGLHRYIVNQGDARQRVLRQLVQVLQSGVVPDESAGEEQDLFLATARQIAEFTAKLHRALASAPKGSLLAPIASHQRSFYQGLRNSAGRLHSLLADIPPDWPQPIPQLAKQVREKFQILLERIYRAVQPGLADGRRIRCHGNFQLSKLLVTEQGLILSDFEGMRHKTIGERRIMQTPLHDVATLFSSMDHLVATALMEQTTNVAAFQDEQPSDDRRQLEERANAWSNRWKQEVFEHYAAALETSALLPASAEGRQDLLQLSCLGEAFRNAEFDLTERPERAAVSLSTILQFAD